MNAESKNPISEQDMNSVSGGSSEETYTCQKCGCTYTRNARFNQGYVEMFGCNICGNCIMANPFGKA